MAKQQFRINHQIKAPEVRLVGDDDEQTVVATPEARRQAEAASLDLVEVAPNAKPPVCRIMDFGKFKYALRKKDRVGGKKTKASGLKELRVRPAIDKHDLSYRLDQGRKFLEAGNKVNVVCIFRGRQRAFPELGQRVMRDVADTLADISKVESPPKMAGNRMTMTLARK